jgi:hypothetical protein
MRIDDINAMADANIIENEINKLAEGVYGKGVKEDYEEGFVDGYNKAREDYEVVSSVREVHQYKLGLEDGYKKARETLYTKEQLIEVIELARLIDYNGSNDYYMSEDEIIKALKP